MDGETKGAETEVMLALELVAARPGNRAARGVEELAASIEREGQLNAIIVRKLERAVPERRGMPAPYQLIAGERRCAALELLGRKAVRARIVEADDARAKELAAIDNLERKDLTPLEEAAVYGELAKDGVSQAEIARRLGRSPQLVAQRLRLLELLPELRALVDSERVDLGAAEVLAQAPHAVQRKLLPQLRAGAKDFPIARGRVRELLEEHTHDLHLAPFDTADATMPGGGCGTCPRRTGTQGSLFAVLEEADVCLDAVCWTSNVDEAWNRKSADAKARGLNVLDERKSARLFDSGGHSIRHDAELTTLDRQVWIDSKNKHVDLEKILPAETPRTLAKHPRSGVPVVLVPRADVAAAIKALEKKPEPAAGAKKAGKGGKAESDAQRQAREHREATALAQRAHAIAIGHVALDVRTERVERRVVLQALVASVFHLVNEDARRQVCKRRGIEPTPGADDNGYRYLGALRMALAQAGKNERAILELGLEVAASDRISFTAYGEQRVHADFDAFKIDMKACRKEAEHELREEAKTKAAKKAAGPAPKKPAAATKRKRAQPNVPF